MSDNDDDAEAVVIDNGTWMCKAGHAGDKTARVYERTVIGREQDSVGEAVPCEEYVGSAAMERREFLAISFPMERGVVTKWDLMEKFWNHIFTRELRGGVKDSSMLITEVPNTDSSNRKKMLEVLFETFDVPSLYIADPAPLALYSSGRTSGAVLDVGGAVSHAVAVSNCGAAPTKQPTESLPTIHRVDIGGNDVTARLAEIVDKRHGTDYSSSQSKLSYIEDMKDFITGAPCRHQSSTETETYQLPDGTRVEINSEVLSCVEALFQHGAGIDVMLCDVIGSCDLSVRKDIINNVILSGGTTLSPGIIDRIKTSLDTLASEMSTEARVVAPPERRKSTWLGGSILASLSEFPAHCKTRADYNEQGWTCFTNFDDANILRKCSE